MFLKKNNQIPDVEDAFNIILSSIIILSKDFGLWNMTGVIEKSFADVVFKNNHNNKNAEFLRVVLKIKDTHVNINADTNIEDNDKLNKIQRLLQGKI